MYRDSDLDIFVDHTGHVAGLEKYLVLAEGYSESDRARCSKEVHVAQDPHRRSDEALYDVKSIYKVCD